MKAVFLTAGAAGMYCGSCMHDNALARAMRDQGVDCVLQPVYTPIRTDSRSVADEHVFFGGIHVYLLQRMPWIHHLPAPIRRTLDWAPLLRWVTSRSHSTDAAQLGALTVSMLKGKQGNQADEVDRLVDWIADDMKADAVLLSNLLIGGALPSLRARLPHARLAVLLQGDDIFLEHLPDEFREEATRICRGLVQHVDQFIVHSDFYAGKMAAMLQIPADKLVVTRLSIDTQPYRFDAEDRDAGGSFRLGYLARVAPEKGLHHLVEAFLQLARQPAHQDLTLHVAGWLGRQHEDYLQRLQGKIDLAGLSDRFRYHGSPDLAEKVRFLRSLDLLSVPTDYEEPKGLFVLEALASGIPVVQPNHGAFGELLRATAGGVVFQPGDITDLCGAIERLKSDEELRRSFAREGSQKVHANHSIEQSALEMKAILFGS